MSGTAGTRAAHAWDRSVGLWDAYFAVPCGTTLALVLATSGHG
ncbi:hypothetical protein [Streptomyces sp. NPDC003393]